MLCSWGHKIAPVDIQFSNYPGEHAPEPPPPLVGDTCSVHGSCAAQAWWAPLLIFSGYTTESLPLWSPITMLELKMQIYPVDHQEFSLMTNHQKLNVQYNHQN